MHLVGRLLDSVHRFRGVLFAHRSAPLQFFDEIRINFRVLIFPFTHYCGAGFPRPAARVSKIRHHPFGVIGKISKVGKFVEHRPQDLLFAESLFLKPLRGQIHLTLLEVNEEGVAQFIGERDVLSE